MRLWLQSPHHRICVSHLAWGHQTVNPMYPVSMWSDMTSMFIGNIKHLFLFSFSWLLQVAIHFKMTDCWCCFNFVNKIVHAHNYPWFTLIKCNLYSSSFTCWYTVHPFSSLLLFHIYVYPWWSVKCMYQYVNHNTENTLIGITVYRIGSPFFQNDSPAK